VITFDVCAASFTDRSDEGTFSILKLLKCYYLNLTLQAYLTDGNISQVKEWDYASSPPTWHSGVDTYYVYRFLLYADFKVLRLLHTYCNIITVV
jgi:hypothetical protein